MKDADLAERAAALLTTAAMKVKRTNGMGLKQRRSRKVRKGICRRRKVPQKSGKGVQKIGKGVQKSSKGVKRRARSTKKKGRSLPFSSLIQSAKISIRHQKLLIQKKWQLRR